MDSALEEAVSSELVSGAGNLIDSGLGGTSMVAKTIIRSVTYGPIPYASEQGIFCALAGN